MNKNAVIDVLLTVREVAQMMKVSERSVRRMITNNADPLPIIKIGRAIRIRPADLERYIAAHRHDSR